MSTPLSKAWIQTPVAEPKIIDVFLLVKLENLFLYEYIKLCILLLNFLCFKLFLFNGWMLYPSLFKLFSLVIFKKFSNLTKNVFSSNMLYGIKIFPPNCVFLFFSNLIEGILIIFFDGQLRYFTNFLFYQFLRLITYQFSYFWIGGPFVMASLHSVNNI